MRKIRIRQWQKDVKKFAKKEHLDLLPLYFLTLEQAMVEYQLGSGILDIKGKEVYEGDTVLLNGKERLVVWRHAGLYLLNKKNKTIEPLTKKMALEVIK